MSDTAENKIEVVFIRHAKTPGNMLKKYVGAMSDEDILDEEKSRITPLSDEFDLLISSPMKRCISTLELLCPGRDFEIIDDFIETDFGSFEGKTYDELKNDARYIEWLESGGETGFPGGERLSDCNNRIIRGLNKMISYCKDGNNKILALVHGGTIMSILSELTNGNYYDYQVDNLCGYKVEFFYNNGNLICDTVETYTAIK